jgi:undecaprenyl diphosphate synthase
MGTTAGNDRMLLNLALSYGGRTEITEMVQQIAGRVAGGTLGPGDIDETVVADHLYTRGLPDPDLLIRTSGEMRLSNFLLWQLAYAEFFVTDTLWPDFTPEEFVAILTQYQQRDRRFGKVKA